MSDKRIVAELAIETGNSKQNLHEVTEALAKSGEAGVRSANSITQALENIERGEDNLNRKINEGRTVTEKDAKAMIQQFSLLEDQIRKTFGSLADAPQQLQDAFRKAEVQVEHTKAKVRDLTDAVDDQKGTLKEGGETWTNLGDAVEKSAGRFGSVIAKAGLLTAAFTEGWQIGMKLNQFFGVDMQTWDDALDRISKKGKIIITEASNELVAFGGVLKAVFTPGAGWTDNILKAQKEFQDQLKVSEGRIKDLDKTLREDEEQHKKNADAAAKAATAAKDLAEKKEKLREETEKTAKALAAETTELDKQVKAAQESKNQLIDNTATLFHMGITLDLANAKLEQQRRVVDQLTKTYGENDPMTRQAVEQFNRLQAQVSELKGAYDNTSAAVEKYKEQNAKANASIDEHSKKIEQLRHEHGKLEDSVAKAAAAVTAATSTTQAATQAAHEAQQKVTGWYDAQGKLHISNTETAESAQKMKEAAERVGNAAEAASGAVHGWKDATGHITIVQDQAASAAEKAVTSTQNLANAQQSAQPAAEAAAATAGQVADALGRAAPSVGDYATQLKSAAAAVNEIDAAHDRLLGRLKDITTELRTILELTPQAAQALEDLSNAGMGGDDSEAAA